MLFKQLFAMMLCLLVCTTISAANTNNGISQRVDSLEGRTDVLEGRADALEGRADTVEGRADALEGRADAVEGRTDALEGRADAVEGRTDALEELTLQQQDQIDQNTSDIQDLKNSGGGGGGLGWALMDSDPAGPKLIGTLVSVVSSYSALVGLSSGGESFVATAFRNGFQNSGYTLYFTSSDCSPPAYADSYFGTSELQSVSMFIGEGDVNSRLAYKAVGGPTTADIKSYVFQGYASCESANWPGYPVVPIESLGTDFNEEYPPPYTLVKQ